jgi:hypothetical protein
MSLSSMKTPRPKATGTDEKSVRWNLGDNPTDNLVASLRKRIEELEAKILVQDTTITFLNHENEETLRKLQDLRDRGVDLERQLDQTKTLAREILTTAELRVQAEKNLDAYELITAEVKELQAPEKPIESVKE